MVSLLRNLIMLASFFRALGIMKLGLTLSSPTGQLKEATLRHDHCLGSTRRKRLSGHGLLTGRVLNYAPGFDVLPIIRGSISSEICFPLTDSESAHTLHPPLLFTMTTGRSISPMEAEHLPLHAPIAIRPLAESTAEDWLAHGILTVKTIAAGAELIPLPYIRAALSTVVIFLETVDVCRTMFYCYSTTHGSPRK